MFISNAIVVDIEDNSIQSITSRPINEQIVPIADGVSDIMFPVNTQEIKISVVTPLGMLHEIPIQFTDALYGAKIPNTAEFGKGEKFIEVAKVFDQAGVGNFVNADIGVLTGSQYEDPAEAETHFITGTVSEDAIVSVLEKDEHTLIKQESVYAGTYEVEIPYRAEVDVIAKSDEDGEVLGHGNIVPEVIVE